MRDAEKKLFNHRLLTVLTVLLFVALSSVTMALAQDDEDPLTLTVITQPAAISVLEEDKGVTLRFEAKKGEEEVSYQWFKSTDGTTATGEAIENATADSLETGAFEEKEIRYYFCVATVGEESVTSDVAAVAYTGLPVLYLNTEVSMEEITQDAYVFGTMKLAYGNDSDDFTYTFSREKNREKKEGIKGRGNTTWLMDKKGYTIKFDKKQSLFGLPAAKKWCIIANYADKTLLRNVYASLLAKNIFNNAECAEWNPSFHPVEVVWDGVYQGNYILCECNTIGIGRVDVQDISDYSEENIGNGRFVDKNGDEIVDLFDGGFILEIDGRRDSPFWFETEKAKAPVALKDPDEVSEYIQEHVRTIVQTAENALYLDNFKDAEDGWRKYFDEDSVIDWFFVNEIARNHDAKDFSSIYKFYSPADEKLHYGPIWDFDVGFGNDGDGEVAAVTGWYVKNGIWTARMFEDPLFVANVINRWNEKKDDLYVSVDTFFSMAGDNSISAELNFMKWDILGKKVYTNSAGYEERLTYQSEVDYMKTWVEERIDWIDNALNNSFFISYDLDGGILATPNREVFLSEDTEPFTLNNPTKEGFVFAGWSGTDIEGMSESVEVVDDGVVEQNEDGAVGKFFKANWKVDITTFDVSFDQNDFFYNGNRQTPDVVVSLGETVLVANTDYVVSFADNLNAGEATVTITGIGDYVGELEKTFTIAPKPVTLTVDDTSKMYGESDPEFTYTVEGIAVIDGVAEELNDVELVREEGEELGEYAIKVTLNKEANPNYVVTVEPAKFTIWPNNTEIIVTVKGESKIVTYSGTEHSVSGFELVSSLAAYSTDLVNFFGNDYVAGTSAGTYMYLSKSDFENTDVNYSNVSFVIEGGQLTIEPALVTISVNSCGKVYGEKDPESGFSAEITGLVVANGVREDLIGVKYVRAEGEDAGEYRITAVVDEAANPNYAVTVKDGVYTIEEKPVIVTTGSASKEYDGKPLTDEEASIEGLVPGEIVTICTTGAQTEIGSSNNTYDIDWGTAKSKNYKVTEKLGRLTVEHTNHTYEWVIDKEPTCSEAGEKHEECSVCHAKQKEGTVIDPTGEHTFEWVIDKEPTCSEAGEKHEECTACHAKQKEGTVIDPTGEHTFVWVIDKEPADGAAGEKHEECTVCHAKQKEGTLIDPTGEHTFEWVIDKEPTCGEAGEKHEECTVCHTKQKEGTVIDPTGEHDWDEWKVTAEPEVGKAGERKRTCSSCGETETEIIPALIGYFVTVGADSDRTKGSSDSIKITVKRSEDDANCINHYVGTLIDGNPVPASAEAGSTIVTISADTLEKLSAGTHTVMVVFDDGQAVTNLTIKAASAPIDPTTPKTGDNSRMMLWVSLLCMSGAALAAVIVAGRKRKVRS